MIIQEIVDILKCSIVYNCNIEEKQVKFACASDLMSDVLTLKEGENVLLITGLCNIQTIRTAEMAGVKYILFVRNKQVTQEMIELAQEEEMILLQCKYSLFRAAGELYMKGLQPLY
ncbi:MAG: hypothetical protein LBR28_02155 [Bacteroidales bacterium]|jgi:predicted transcriptional regulator|nr:hypothetical protein [Bacteroidales bacterium]